MNDYHVPTRIAKTTCCSSNFPERWPWTINEACDALLAEAELDKDCRTSFDAYGNVRTLLALQQSLDRPTYVPQEPGALLSNAHIFQECIERADWHDLGRTVFSLMNSPFRQVLLNHVDLQRIMSTIQRARILFHSIYFSK